MVTSRPLKRRGTVNLLLLRILLPNHKNSKILGSADRIIVLEVVIQRTSSMLLETASESVHI